MPSQEAGSIGTQRNDPQMIGAGEIQGGTRELGGQSFALKWRGHFGVLQHETIRESAIANKRAKPIHRGLEAVGLFIVGDDYIVPG